MSAFSLIGSIETSARGDSMDIIVRRSALDSCEKVFERSLCLEEAAESVVPDTQPDAEYILCAGGAAFIRSKDVNAGRVGLSAQAEVTALYAAEGSGGICALSAVVPINVELEAPEVTPESLAVADICLTNVEAKLLNPRKAVIRCTASVRLECYNPGELYVSAGLEGEGAEKVETLCGTCTVNPVVCVKEKTFAVSDEYQLQPGLLPHRHAAREPRRALPRRRAQRGQPRRVQRGACARGCSTSRTAASSAPRSSRRNFPRCSTQTASLRAWTAR